MKKLFLFVAGCLLLGAASAQQVYPSNWWVGMKHSTIQVIVRGEGVGKATGVTVNYPGVTVIDWHRATSPNYLFMRLRIAPGAKPGTVTIGLKGAGTVGLPLAKRRDGNGTVYAQGVNSADLIYFLMPDRWSNGDPGNDRIAGLRDQSLNRDSMYLRHGGDFQGIINHLDYLQQLGLTAPSMTTAIPNAIPNRTENCYAFTTPYTIDPRLGGAAM